MYIHIMYHGKYTGLDIPQLRDDLVQSHIIVHFAQVLSHYSHNQQLEIIWVRSWNLPNLIGVCLLHSEMLLIPAVYNLKCIFPFSEYHTEHDFIRENLFLIKGSS